MPDTTASPSAHDRFWHRAGLGLVGAVVVGFLWLAFLNWGVILGLGGAGARSDGLWLGRLWMAGFNAAVASMFFLPISVAIGFLAAWAMPRLTGLWRAAAFGAGIGLTLAILWSAVIAWGFYFRGEYRATPDLWGRFWESLSDAGMISAVPFYAAWIALWSWQRGSRS